MEPNFIIFLAAAIILVVIREIWYHDKVFGTALAKVNNWSEAPPKKMNRILQLGLTLVLGLIIAFMLSGMVIHQAGVYSLLVGIPEMQDPSSEVSQFYATFVENYGDRHRSFGHGALHGGIVGLLFVTPVFALLGFTEKRGFKYTLIHGGFWFVTLLIMGGLICAWGY